MNNIGMYFYVTKEDVKRRKRTMKIFRISAAGDTWTVAAQREQEAIDHLLGEQGFEMEDVDVGSIREVPEEEWKNIAVSFDEEDEETGEQITIALNELMKPQTETQIMCSTAWLTYI